MKFQIGINKALDILLWSIYTLNSNPEPKQSHSPAFKSRAHGLAVGVGYLMDRAMLVVLSRFHL